VTVIQRTIEVALGARTYPIFIGSGLIGDGARLCPYLAGSQVLIVTNETLAPLYLERLERSLAGLQTASVILPDGEQYKTLETCNRIFDALLARRFARDATLVALGGGVIGDMAGFAAACYQRGVAFIQVPTTLLAQVDSSVGGKTGVNHPRGKNMIGAFHQPRAVLADTDTLATLPDRELSAGLAEVIKYGLIRDRPFFEWLEGRMSALRARDPAALVEAITRSCENKAAVVAADEREGGQRALLNLGHTFGHAIETGVGYGTWLHGEAVGAGMVLAASLSARSGWLDWESVARIRELVAAAGLPTRSPDTVATGRLVELMAVDKKVVQGRLRFVVLNGIGDAFLTTEVPIAEIRAAFTDARSLASPERLQT